MGAPCDSYVVARVFDPRRPAARGMEARTRVELNEASPKFNFKTDFVNVSGALRVCWRRRAGGQGTREAAAETARRLLLRAASLPGSPACAWADAAR
jgi:hypothetical protein